MQKIFDDVIDQEIRNNKIIPYYDREKNAAHQTRFVEKHFAEAVENIFHFNVYDYPFDCEKGYSIILHENVELFIFQLEQLSQLDKVLGEFLNIEDFVLYSDNIGDLQWYKKYYREARKKVKIDRDLLNEVYSDKYMNHFYSEKQIAGRH